jgi:putative phosphoesterase
MLVGLVSDSHGLADPALPRLFRGCDLVLHAGDLVKPAVLEALQAIAPVRGVRGNNDHLPGLAELPLTILVPLGALTALVVHDLGRPERPHRVLASLMARERPHIVVHGHSHRPAAAVVGGALVVNPGSAGPRRFSLPRSAALLAVARRRARVTLYDLGPSPPAPLGAPVEAELG